MAKVKVTAISYLNTLPFLHGVRHSEVMDNIDLSIVTPAQCAQQLKTGQTDLSLVPVAIIPTLPYYEIITDYCIGATGKVRSVVLLSNDALPDIRTLYLDTESRTSALLVRVLAKHHWKINPKFKPFSGQTIKEHEGCVLIGDKVFSHEKNYTYHYDLAETWINYTGLPFAFAAWTTIRPLSAHFIEKFNTSLSYGLNHIPQALTETLQNKKNEKLPCSYDTASEYLSRNISYSFDADKKNGIAAFWNLINDFSL